jgi:hypothetical protein
MAAKRATKANTRRTDDDKAADRTAAVAIVADMRSVRDDCRTALKALPAPATRNAAQKRDALLLRSAIVTARSHLLALGVGTPADRDGTDT